MARYFSRLYGRRKDRVRRWIYIISALLVIVVATVFIRHQRLSPDEGETSGTLIGPGAPTESKTIAPEVVEPELKLLEVSLESTAEDSPEVAELIIEAMTLINEGPAKIIEVRDRLNEALPIPMSRQQRAFVKERLSELADKWLFGWTILPQDRLCESYKVKAGDELRIIGKRFKVPYEILMEINNIRHPKQLQAGETIKVINGPFHVRIYRSTFTMDLYLQNTFVRSFPVGLGKPGRETPTGLWVVEPGGKLIKPTWTDPDTGRTYKRDDPDYPLGSRWIGLKGIKRDAVGRDGIAFHGTNDPNLIGTVGSRGCIRLNNGDAILIYNLLMPGLSQVEIVE